MILSRFLFAEGRFCIKTIAETAPLRWSDLFSGGACDGEDVLVVREAGDVGPAVVKIKEGMALHSAAICIVAAGRLTEQGGSVLCSVDFNQNGAVLPGIVAAE